MNDFKKYLVVREYWNFWALDFNSHSLGCTLEIGTRDEVNAAMQEYSALSETEFVGRLHNA